MRHARLPLPRPAPTPSPALPRPVARKLGAVLEVKANKEPLQVVGGVLRAKYQARRLEGRARVLRQKPGDIVEALLRRGSQLAWTFNQNCKGGPVLSGALDSHVEPPALHEQERATAAVCRGSSARRRGRLFPRRPLLVVGRRRGSPRILANPIPSPVLIAVVPMLATCSHGLAGVRPASAGNAAAGGATGSGGRRLQIAPPHSCPKFTCLPFEFACMTV